MECYCEVVPLLFLLLLNKELLWVTAAHFDFTVVGRLYNLCTIHDDKMKK